VKTYTVVLSPELEGGYSVSCPAMPGAVSQGDTRDDALANIAEAMAAWYEVAAEYGDGPLEETVQVVAEQVAFVLGWKAEEGWPLLVETAAAAA
jgi:predicted RNase H-like HicB family nuclease